LVCPTTSPRLCGRYFSTHVILGLILLESTYAGLISGCWLDAVSLFIVILLSLCSRI
jgi:hypothetical protein